MFSTISVCPGFISPQKLNPVEPPWYGPVCLVVWEGQRREAPPYPDHVAGMLGLEPNADIGGERGRRVHETASALFVVRAGWFAREERSAQDVARFADTLLRSWG